MESDRLIDRLEANANVVQWLAEGVTREQATWKPVSGKWSILEVVAHLSDEEREDFRARLRLLLLDPESEWPPIDPQGWVATRDYASKDLKQTLQDFLTERTDSIAWLRGLDKPEWGRTKTHPAAGPLSAGDLLVSWVAHDLLHIRQLVGLHHGYLHCLAKPYSTSYADS